jgi:hypothetical protein
MTKHEPFIMLPYALYDSPIYAALRPIHVAVLLLLLRKHNGRNNGSIPLGTREAARRCHCSQSTACRALTELQLAGFITVTRKGHLVPEIGRPDVASRWRLNFLQEASPTNAISRRPERSPNASSGCSSSASSIGPPFRSRSASSVRDALGERSINNLTRGRSHRVRGSGYVSEPLTNPSVPPSLGSRDAPAAKKPDPGKPNGADRTVATGVVVPLRRGKHPT